MQIETNVADKLTLSKIINSKNQMDIVDALRREQVQIRDLAILMMQAKGEVMPEGVKDAICASAGRIGQVLDEIK